MSILDDIDEVERQEHVLAKKVWCEFEQTLNQMDELHTFVKLWENAIGKENINNINIKGKKTWGYSLK